MSLGYGCFDILPARIPRNMLLSGNNIIHCNTRTASSTVDEAAAIPQADTTSVAIRSLSYTTICFVARAACTLWLSGWSVSIPVTAFIILHHMAFFPPLFWLTEGHSRRSRPLS